MHPTLHDPWGLGQLMASQGQGPTPVMPPMHASRTLVIGPHPHMVSPSVAVHVPPPHHGGHDLNPLHALGHAITGLAHFMASGNRAQLKYEKARDITYALQGGPGGTAMPYAAAKSIAHDAVYNRGKHPRR
jgi:hypothetical protein